MNNRRENELEERVTGSDSAERTPGNERDRDKDASKKHCINKDIRALTLRVIGADGENYGLVTRAQALAYAEAANLDLVQVGVAGDVVIAKIMDFGKFLYEKKKQDNRAKKSQKVIQIKEIKLRPVIGDQDYAIKLRQAIAFLKEGKHVKFTIQFRRGRELASMDQVGEEMFRRVTSDLIEHEVGTLVEEKEQRGRIAWSKIYYVKGS